MKIKQMSVQARALHRAAAVSGGLLPLSRHLGVPDQSVREWMFDVGSPPNGVFLRVIDLLLEQPVPEGLSVANDTAANVTRL
jgi:hypothetical protein